MFNKKKAYAKEFKEETMRLAQKNGNICETARSLGLHNSVLRRWRTALAQEGEQTLKRS
jgi:transposase-like protein